MDIIQIHELFCTAPSCQPHCQIRGQACASDVVVFDFTQTDTLDCWCSLLEDVEHWDEAREPNAGPLDGGGEEPFEECPTCGKWCETPIYGCD